MKKFKITKEQIKKLSSQDQIVEEFLEEWFPEAFETKLEEGKWYKDSDGDLFFITEFHNGANGYGWIKGDFVNQGCIRNNYWTNEKKNYPATESEVFEALKKEALKQGFKISVRANGSVFGNSWFRNHLISEGDFNFSIELNQLCLGGCAIFKDGKWASIIKTKSITKQEAENRLNKIDEEGYTYTII